MKFKRVLEAKNIKVSIHENEVICSAEKKTYSFSIANNIQEGLPIDIIVTEQEKLSAIILSKLKLNKTIFARNCEVKKVNKQTTEIFLKKYHLMNSTQSAFNYGLIYKDELLALASFSKGRKMNRLPENKRSFELIRFCCKEGITVTGGLTKLIKHFCIERSAGDVMTYVDKQFSNGESFIKAGFFKHSETNPNYFLVNKKTFVRNPFKNPKEKFNTNIFYLVKNSGNIKMVYAPNK